MTQSILSKLSTPHSTKGFSLVELIVGGLVSLLVLSVTFQLIVEQRRLFLGDQSKTNLYQNLRTASDFIGTDAKQVGENIEGSSNLPVVRLISGVNDTDPDTLILQKKLIPDELLLCEDISATDNEIVIANSAINCNYSNGDGDNLTDSLLQFKTQRCELESSKTACDRGENDATAASINSNNNCDDECIFGYIHDPANNRGEFFIYTDETFTEDSTTGDITNRLHVIPLGPNDNFYNTYSVSQRPVIYILEEKKYALCDGILQVTTNRVPNYGDDCPFPSSGPRPARLVDSIGNFQVSLQTDAGTLTNFNEDLGNLTSFRGIESINVQIETQEDELIETETNTLSLETRFFPRNTISDF